MTSINSVSKGVFIYKNGFKRATKKTHKPKYDEFEVQMRSKYLWYNSYKDLWSNLEEQLEDIKNKMFATVLKDLLEYIKKCYEKPVTEIPTAALLTGINMPDHKAQFDSLTNLLKIDVTPHIVNLTSDNCKTMKQLIKNLCFQLINTENNLLPDEDDISDEQLNSVKQSQCNFGLIKTWYEKLINNLSVSPSKRRKTIEINKRIIVVIISDFESFNENILQDFISVASSHLNVIPFVFVFGVATSLTVLHRYLPFHVSSKVKIEVFKMPPSTGFLNNIIDNVFLTSNCPFLLGGKVINLFTDIFLFYDLSVSNFIQNFKYALLEHFSYGNAMALCNKNYKDIIDLLTHDDFENCRRLLSFRRLVENEKEPEIRIRLLNDDDYFIEVLRKELRKVWKYIQVLPIFLKCLQILVEDLPKAPLGKHLRELYSLVVSKRIINTLEYKECFQLLEFQSKDEFCKKIQKIIGILNNNVVESKKANQGIEQICSKLNEYLFEIYSNVEGGMEVDNQENEDIESIIVGQMDRLQLKTVLMQNTKKPKVLSHYEKIRKEVLNYLSEVFEIFLREPQSFYFHEIYVFNDISIQENIIGTHRTAIHAALNDPQCYIQCSCCGIDNDSIILKTMPDISIAYKLHMECGKMINLYDWLQAFLSIIDPQDIDDESKRIVNPELLARFTQAVAELEYLGFIKSSKRKTDHVARLTWGG